MTDADRPWSASTRSPSATAPLTVLDDLDLDIARGEKVAIIGPSGSGKTTVLRMLMTLETINDGVIWVEGEPLTHMERNGALVPADPGPHPPGPRQDRHGVPVLQPLPAHDGAGELHRGADDRARHVKRPRPRRAPPSSSTWSASPTRRATIRRSSPAASSSAWRSPAPAPCGRRSCCSTR